MRLAPSFVLAFALASLAACSGAPDAGEPTRLAAPPPAEEPHLASDEPADPIEPLAADTDPPVTEAGLTDEAIDGDVAAPPAAKPLPAIPAACTTKGKIVTYAPRGFRKLLDAFEKDLSPCADYFMFLPALVADKTMPRGPLVVQDVHARAGRFHAVAEVHFQTWKNVTNLTWYQRGVEFRKRMAAAGYDVARGDTWAINELPSTVRYDAATRAAVRNLVRGLYDGPAGSPKRAGIVYVIGFDHDSENVSVLEQRTKEWLADGAFWQTMNDGVLYWGQEAYAKPAKACVDSALIGARASHVNDFGMHPATLAQAGSATEAPARKFFAEAYFSLLTASWKQDLYGQTNVSLDAMKKFVSLEVYAQRAHGASNPYPDGRLGLSWHDTVDGATPEQLAELAARTAAAISGAYGVDGKAVHACSPSGAFTWCDCAVAGASFTEIWKAFETF